MLWTLKVSLPLHMLILLPEVDALLGMWTGWWDIGPFVVQVISFSFPKKHRSLVQSCVGREASLPRQKLRGSP